MADARGPSDEDLVRRFRAGDASVVATLFDRHLPMLRAQVKRRLPAGLRGKVGESDVVQDAWLAAFQRLPEFEDRGEGSFGRWLRQIAEHKVVDEVRRHVAVGKRDARREVRMATGEEPAARRTGDRSPMSEVVAAEQEAGVREAISELSSDDRDVLRYLHEEGLTAAEVGERMGRSAEAVRKLYGRALGRLADRLDDPRTTRS
jgi:RNA polymerase sigma-70 factor (ECF subfamily)